MGKVSKTFLMAGAAFAAMAGACSGPAAAQTSAAPGAEIEEVVVTAQRREESGQSVPIAIAAFSETALQRQSVRSAEDLAVLTPGLSFNRAGSGSGTPFLRGVGSNVTTPGSEAAVSTYVDNVYVGSQYASIYSFNNIASIEIDKGPQGTLFGRNATGGVIQITTKDPTQERQGRLRLGYGNYQTIEGNLYVTGGVTDTLAADLAIFYRNQQDGWGANIATGKDVFYAENFSVRSKWVWSPSEDTKATLVLSASDDFNQLGTSRSIPAGQAFRPPGPSGNPGPILNTNPGFYNVSLDWESYAKTKQGAASLKVWHDWGPVEGVTITSYRKAEVHGPIDSDGSAAAWRYLDTYPATETFTQELQLMSSADEASRLKWIVGGFYYRDKATVNPFMQLGYGSAPIAPVEIRAYQTTTSFSVYAQGTYDLTDDTRLTVGLRETADFRETAGTRTVLTNPPTVTTVTTQPGSTIPSARKADYSRPTWKLALDHDLAEGVMVYASYSRGFKAGVFNTVSLNTDPVEPEVIDAYELGLKSDWFDRRLRVNAAAYYYDYSNLQLNQYVNGFYILNNAAKAEIKGLDIEITGRPIADLQLQLSGTFLDPKYTSYPGGQGYAPVPITSVNPSGGMGGFTQTPTDLSGKQMILTPKTTLNASAFYTWRLDQGDITANILASYRSRVFFDPQNGATQPAYTTINASLGWTSPGGVWEARVFGANLTDEKAYVSITRSTTGDGAIPGAPRTFGVGIERRF